MYEIETVRVYTEESVATGLLREMLDSPAETFVVGSQDFIAGLPESADPAVIVHKDVAASGPNVVVTGDARCWVETPGGTLVFRSGFFADEMRASFGVTAPTQQPPAPAAPPVEAPAAPPTDPVQPPAEPPVPPAEPTAPAPDAGLVFVPTGGDVSAPAEPDAERGTDPTEAPPAVP